MLRLISSRRLASRAAEGFVREIARQAIICQSSMMAREVGYKGFHAAPVLSQALFEDRFINSRYQPLSGLESRDLTNIDRNLLDSLFVTIIDGDVPRPHLGVGIFQIGMDYCHHFFSKRLRR